MFNERKVLPFGPQNKSQGLHFIINHSPVFKCAAQKSFHDISSCQDAKPGAYIPKFKPGQQHGRRAATSLPLGIYVVAGNLQHEHNMCVCVSGGSAGLCVTGSLKGSRSSGAATHPTVVFIELTGVAARGKPLIHM